MEMRVGMEMRAGKGGFSLPYLRPQIS